MESLGQKLREARERLNVSLEQVARDTHISKQYLEALEDESFGMIPGETYIIGFLRNYAEYLALNPEELVSLYRNLRIQEQPLPMSELLDRGQPKVPRRFLLWIVVLVVVLGAAAFLIYRFGFAGREPRPRAEQASAQSSEGATEQFRFQEEAVTRWFSQDEVLDVPVNGGTYQMTLAEVGNKLSLRIPGGSVELNIGEERQLDLNTDGRNDVLIRLNDLDATEVARRANISLYKITKDSLVQVPAESATPSSGDGAPGASVSGEGIASGRVAGDSAAGDSAAGALTSETGAGASGALASEGASVTDRGEPPGTVSAAGTGPITVLTAASPSPFRLGINFRGYCLLRYRVDNETRDERFFHKGETFALDGKNEVMLWVSNAGALRLSVGGREIELGRPGEVSVKLVRWSRDESSGQYLLQVIDQE
jgi:cytoskeleton protein RodZ